MLNLESIFNHYNIFYGSFSSDLSSKPQSKLNFGALTTSPECMWVAIFIDSVI